MVDWFPADARVYGKNELPLGAVTGTLRYASSLTAQLLQTNGINRREVGVKHADPLLRSVTACQKGLFILARFLGSRCAAWSAARKGMNGGSLGKNASCARSGYSRASPASEDGPPRKKFCRLLPTRSGRSLRRKRRWLRKNWSKAR